jgi:hypothetical protein
MPAVFTAVRCVSCSALHDVYVAGAAQRKRAYAFTCPITGEHVRLSPRGKVLRDVKVVPPAAVLATICAATHRS